jgi:hypothetical protein
MTREGLADKQVSEQLIVDIQKYRTHPECKVLFCFVYDPKSLLRNPESIERDLSKPKDDTKVYVHVNPK